MSADPIYRTAAWRRVRELVLRRDAYTCQVRGPLCTIEATAADHRISWRDGGAWYDPANLRASCQPCNSQRVSTTKATAGGVSPSREW